MKANLINPNKNYKEPFSQKMNNFFMLLFVSGFTFFVGIFIGRYTTPVAISEDFDLSFNKTKQEALKNQEDLNKDQKALNEKTNIEFEEALKDKDFDKTKDELPKVQKDNHNKDANKADKQQDKLDKNKTDNKLDKHKLDKDKTDKDKSKEKAEKADKSKESQNKKFTIQTGFFKDKQFANIKVKELKEKGYDARIVVSIEKEIIGKKEKEKECYKVNFGTFNSREEASKVLKDKRMQGFVVQID